MLKDLNRRQFINATVVGGGALIATPMLSGAQEVAATTAPAVPTGPGAQVTLGKTGIKTSFLALGTGLNGSRRSSAHTRMGEEKFLEIIHHAMDKGVSFMDMADLYGSHPFMKKALEGRDRDKYTLLTKIWPRTADWNTFSGGAREEVDRFRKEIGVEMIDICLIHCATNDRWATEYEKARDELSALKEEGAVRAVGVSCHDHGALKVAADLPWVDVILARINNKGNKMDGTPEEISATLRTAQKNGKSIVGMKIFGEGTLTAPEQMDASLEYVIGNHLVDAMTIGMMNVDEVTDCVERITKTCTKLRA